MRKALLIGAAVFFFLALVAGGVGYWIVYSPNTQDYEGTRSVVLPRDVRFEAAVDSLKSRGILDAEQTFKWMASVTGWGDQVKSGHYLIPSDASNYDILSKLRRGLRDPVRLTIPPGTRPEVVAAVAGRDMAFTPDEFMAALKDTALAAELGTDTTHLFGYMHPETYQLYWLSDASTVVRKIKRQSDRFYEQLKARQPDSLSTNLSHEEVINLASIVEWETYYIKEKPTIAEVYLNRLERGIPLQADPTIQYALLAQEGRKRRLLFEDYELNHPYNTYNYRGLPPGPITNPSPTSIRAVMNPEEHDYLYFVVNPDSAGHTFSRTLREHNRAANRYRQAMRELRRRQRRQRDSIEALKDTSSNAQTPGQGG